MSRRPERRRRPEALARRVGLAVFVALSGSLVAPAGPVAQGTVAAATPRAPAAAAVPAALGRRLAIDLATALVLAGEALPVRGVASAAVLRAAPTLGRRGAGLTRVHRLDRLREGARGDAVRLLQARLDGLGATLAIDGVFGPKTLAALEHVAPADRGVVTAATWRWLLGDAVAADGLSAWALAARYATTPASLAAWNGVVVGRTSAAWSRPLAGRVWVMPPDVRPGTAVLGSGRLAPARSSGGARGASRGSSGAVGPADGAGPGGAPPATAAILVVDVQPPAPAGAVERLAAWLGGHQVRATVVLPVAALAGAGASALALEGEELGVRLGRRSDVADVARALAAAAAATGQRPLVAYAGAYPDAAVAAVAAHAGVALVVGARPGSGATATAGEVYVIARPAATLVPAVAAFVARARRGRAPLAPAAASLDLVPAS
jgi:peptidoglycan hydrolase-like protein with peptidoglycan-binding domain